MSTAEQVMELVKTLPEDLQSEVADFARFLKELRVDAQRRRSKAGYRLRQDWAGGMKEYRDQYTALELQKKTLEWRGD